MVARGFLVVAACLSCLGCRAATSAAPTGGSPTAGVQASAAKTVVYAYYFHQTFRCMSCQMTEEMAARAIEEHFAGPAQAGLVVWMPVNIDKPEGRALGQQFNARATDLVLARTENGVCKESKKLDELAGLRDRPDAFSKYLIDQIAAYLSPVQSK